MFTKNLILFLTLCYLGCAGQKESDYQKNFALKALVDNRNNSQLNPTTSCLERMSAMQICAGTSPEFSAFTLTETVFISAISRNQFTNYTDYCNQTLVNDPYKNQSDSLKVCFLKCDASYWQTRRNLNICNETFTSMVQGSFTDNGTILCKRNCVTPTNNIP